MPAFGVHEVRVAVRSLDEPERAIADAERMLDVQHPDAGCVEGHVLRLHAPLEDVAHDRIE